MLKSQTTQTLNYRKRLFAFLSILIIIVFSSFIVPAQARSDAIITVGPSSAPTATYNTAELQGSSIAPFTFKLCYYVYGGLINNIANSDYLKIDTTATYWAVFKSAYESVVPIGLGLAVLWVCVDLIERAQMDQMTPEVLIRWGIKLIIAIMVMDNLDELLEDLITAGNGFNDMMTGSASTATNTAILDSYFAELKVAKLFGCLSVLIELMIPSVAMIVAYIFMYVLVFARIIELGIRTIFSPVGIADFFTHGASSPGMRYIKKYFAIALQGAALIAILYAGSALSATVSAGGDSLLTGTYNVLLQVIIAVSMIGVMLRSQTIVNDIVGA